MHRARHTMPSPEPAKRKGIHLTTLTDQIGEVLGKAKNIAVVGLSSSPMRPSYGVAAYMQGQGYKIIPVNPTINGALGEKAYPDLSSVPEKIDIVNVFRRSDALMEVVDEAIRLKVPVLWMQEDVINEEAAEKARAAGITVMMDKCILKEHRKRNR
jgi:uncharacterized protein